MSEKKTKNTTKKSENKVVDFPKKENGIEVEIVDQNYRLGEMAEAMDQSIANARKVAKEQALLVSIISRSEEAKNFKDFIKESEAIIDKYNAQASTLTIRSGLLKQVAKVCAENKDVSKIVSMLLKALGVFEQ